MDESMESASPQETLNYQIRTEGFEKILLAMQHITQRIKKEKSALQRLNTIQTHFLRK